MFQVDAIMTLLQKINLAVAVILFLLGTGGTVALGMYVLNDCQSSAEDVSKRHYILIRVCLKYSLGC